MAIVELRTPLRELAGGAREVEVTGRTVGDALTSLERLHPSVAGWARDERGRVRQHVALFVNGRRAGVDEAIAQHDRLAVIGAISGGAGVELLVGTRKGLVVVRGERGGAFEPAGRHFPGQEVAFAMCDRRSGRVFASVVHGQFGPRLYWSDDPDGAWEIAAGLSFPDDTETALERVWIVCEGEGEGVLFAGVAPAALFRSDDGGRSWELVRGLWDHPTRPEWQPGGGGMCLHSICPWPGHPERLAVGVSAAGVWLTNDGGESWRRGVDGLVARYLPEEAREGALALCVHNMHRAPLEPSTLYMQFHGGVYRSDDAGECWIDLAAGTDLVSDFGFPMVAHPREPDRAYLIPLAGDFDRVAPDGRLAVWETTDRGTTWVERSTGLPSRDAWLVVLRQAFCCDGAEPLGLYFGATSGDLFGSFDAGATWTSLAQHLPPVLSVRPG